MKKIVIALVLLLVLAGLGGAGYWYFFAAGSRGPALATEPVVRDDLLATISATGTLEPEDVIDVGAQVAGQIKEFGEDVEANSSTVYPARGARTAGYLSAPFGNGALLAAASMVVEPPKLIDYRSVVRPGTVLAKIDDALFVARVAASRADLEQADANVAQAKASVASAQADLEMAKTTLAQADRDLKRGRRLTGSISQEEFETTQSAFDKARVSVAAYDASLLKAKAALPGAEAAVNRAKATLLQDETNLGYATIKVPDSVGNKGVIIERRVTIGQTVQSSFNTPSLFLIAKDLTRMKVWASVNEADIGQVKVGQQVSFTVDARPGDVFKGVVNLIRLNATMTQNVVTYTVEVLVDNSEGKLLPYMTANLQFEVNKREHVLLIPNSALRWRPAAQMVAPEDREAFLRASRRREGLAGEAAAPEKEQRSRGTVWIVQGNFVKPVKVRLGLTDGARSEVIEGDLREGLEVVTREAARNGGDSTTNPFAPQMFGGKKQ